MSFSWKDREEALASLSSTAPEVLVIGGGMTGCSTAAHAARLGLNVLLVEKEDLAYGASGNSTGLAHAGLRYLAQGRIGYVFHEGRERYRLQELAPQWVHPFNFILPVYQTDPYRFWVVRLGTWIYDALGWADALVTKRPLVRRHRRLSADEVKARIPGIRMEGLLGGLEYFVDAKLQDARFTLGYAQQAAQHGARVLTHCEISSVKASGNLPNVVLGKDLLGGKDFKCTVPLVINATGAWIDQVRREAGLKDNLVQMSKGVHLVVDHLVHAPLIMASSAKGKAFFVIPIDGERTLVGTTDTAIAGDAGQAQADAHDIAELLHQLFYYFPYLKQGHNLAEAIENYKRVHVRDIYWGIRPLLRHTGSTIYASREHKLTQDLPNFWSIPGVKLTAGRAAGHEAAVAAWYRLRKGAGLPAVTWDSLPGGDLWDFKRFAEDAAKRFKLGPHSEALLHYLVSMYGTRYVEVLQWTQREEHYSEEVVPGEPWIMAQVPYSVYEEMTLTLNDLLWRRTKWAHYRDLPEPVISRIAQLMGRHLGWSQDVLDQQVQSYALELVHHRLPQETH